MRVEWKEEALDKLAEYYVDASREHRELIANTVVWINRELARDPLTLGESRGPLRRVWFPEPLVIDYELKLADDLVLVTHVRLLRM